MAKKDNNIEKSYKLEITERDKAFKRRYPLPPRSKKRLVTIFLMTQMPMIWKL